MPPFGSEPLAGAMSSGGLTLRWAEEAAVVCRGGSVELVQGGWASRISEEWVHGRRGQETRSPTATLMGDQC